MSVSRRHFLQMVLAGTAGAVTMTLAKLGDAEAQQALSRTNIRWVSIDELAEAYPGEEVTADSYILYVHPSVEDDLRNLPEAEFVSADSYAHKRFLANGEIGRLNSMIKFRRSELLPDFHRPEPLQVIRGAKWKHEQRPYHKRFA